MIELPEVGTKFRHPKFPRKIFSFISATHKGDITYWSFIEVNAGKARFFYPDEVILLDEKPKKNKRVQEKKETPRVEGDSKTITIGNDSIEVR
jgi:hypothetical protein